LHLSEKEMCFKTACRYCVFVCVCVCV